MFREYFRQLDRKWFEFCVLFVLVMITISVTLCRAGDPSTGPVMCNGKCLFVSVRSTEDVGSSLSSVIIDSCGMPTYMGYSAGGTHEVMVIRSFFRYEAGLWSSYSRDASDNYLLFITTATYNSLQISQYQDLSLSELQAAYPLGCESGELDYVTEKNLGEDDLCD